MSTPDRSDRVIDHLAHRYRRGDTSALAGLHAALSKTIDIAVSQVIRAGLPPLLEPDELRQEVWTILARLALRWRPADAHFVACVRGSLRWELENVVIRAIPGRRRRQVYLLSLSRPVIARRSDHRVRADWTDGVVDRLLRDHILSVLTPAQARVVTLVALRGHTVSDVGRRLGILRQNVDKHLHRARLRVAPFFPTRATA